MERIKIVILTSWSTLADFSEICDYPVAAVPLVQVTPLLQFSASLPADLKLLEAYSTWGLLCSSRYSSWVRIIFKAPCFVWENMHVGLLFRESPSFLQYGHISLLYAHSALLVKYGLPIWLL